MKKKKVLSVIVFLICSHRAAAFLVSDPTSYSYYVEQIEQGTKSMQKLDKQIKTMDGTLSEIQAMKRTAIGNYKRTMRALIDAKRVASDLKKARPAVDDVMDINNTRGAGAGGKNGAFKDAKAFLAKVFSDPRAGKPSQAILNLRYNVRQKSFQKTITESEKIMKQQKDRMNNMEDLAGAIDKTVNLKDAADLTNRFLFEIVRLNVEMLTVMVSLAESYGLQNYNGVSAKSIKKTNADYKAGRKKKALNDYGFMKEIHAKYGAVTFKDLVNSTNK